MVLTAFGWRTGWADFTPHTVPLLLAACLSSAAITEQHRPGGLQTTNLFLAVLGFASLKSGWQPGQIPVRALFWICRQPAFPPPLAERESGLSGVSFIRALIPFMRVLPSWPYHLPKPPPNARTLRGWDFQHRHFGRKHLVQNPANNSIRVRNIWHNHLPRRKY